MKHVAVWAWTVLLVQLVEVSISAIVRHRDVESKLTKNHTSSVTQEGLHMSFEIRNYNYFDLSKSTCPEDLINNADAHGGPGAGDTSPDPQLTHAMEEIWDKSGSLEDMIHQGMDAVDGAVRETEELGHKAEHIVDDAVHKTVDEGKKIGNTIKGQALLQVVSACMMKRRRLTPPAPKSDECETVEDVFRDAVKEVVHEVVDCYFDHPHELITDEGPLVAELHHGAPAAAHNVPMGMQPTAFLQAPAPSSGPAPAPMMAALTTEEDLDIYVAFEPGHTMGQGKTIIVEILLTDLHGSADSNGLEEILHVIETAMRSREFKDNMAHALKAVTGMRPSMGSFQVKKEKIAMWNVSQCEGHMKSLIKRFSKAYSRERVPSALYNECTNFMTRMSFSHDYVLDPHDIAVCRKTTARFAKHWDYGKNAEDHDFELMCMHACNAKFGKDAPRCRRTSASPAASPAPSPAHI